MTNFVNKSVERRNLLQENFLHAFTKSVLFSTVFFLYMTTLSAMKGNPFEWSVTDCLSLIKVETFGRYGILSFIRIIRRRCPPLPPRAAADTTAAVAACLSKRRPQ